MGLSEPRRKIHACCGYTHAALDALAELRRTNLAELDGAQTTEIRLPPYVLPVADKPDPPSSPHQARFHVRYLAAVAASGRGPVQPIHGDDVAEILAAPDVARTYDRIVIRGDTTLSHYHEVAIRLEHADGAFTLVEGGPPRRSAQNPLADDAVIAKFVARARPVVGVAATSALHTLIEHVEQQSNLDQLSRLLSPGDG